MKRILLSPDAAEGTGDNAPGTTDTPAAEHKPAPPPAAEVVNEGTVTEETLRLRRENDELKRTVKDREQTICDWQDKHETYRKSVETPQPVPVKKAAVEPGESARRGFLRRR